MPWINQSAAAQRLSLVLALLRQDEPVAGVCRRFKVSRQTAYKYLRRFKEEGRRGLQERTRRPRHAGWDKAWRRRVLSLRRRRPTWGARKLRWWLRRLCPGKRLPGERTVQRWLQQSALSVRRVRKRAGPGPQPGAPTVVRRSNDVWTVDFKGWFRTTNGQRIEPLTVRDLHSRYLLAVIPVPFTGEAPVRSLFLRLFRRHGLPKAIRTDRGVPFCGVGPHNLTRISLWWHRLGIRVEFVDRKRGVNNNAHEQMHRVLQEEVASKPLRSLAQAARQLELWRHHYNRHRPHEALGQCTPASRYRTGQSRSLHLAHPRYPAQWLVRTTSNRGTLLIGFISKVFAGLPLALQSLTPTSYRVHFGDLLLGHLEISSRRFTCVSHTGKGGGLRPLP